MLQNKTCLFWKQMARSTSCCHSFIRSPGANFTRASRCLSLCYCFLYIIVPPTCCHSNWRRKREDRGEKKQFQSLQKNLWELPRLRLLLSSFISFIQTFKRKPGSLQTECITTDQKHHAFLLISHLQKLAPCRALPVIQLNRKTYGKKYFMELFVYVLTSEYFSSYSFPRAYD